MVQSETAKIYLLGKGDARMTEIPHETRIALLEQGMGEMKEDIRAIHDSVVGNGKVGLKTRVDRLENKFLTCMGLSSLVGGIGGYILRGLL